MTDQREYDAKLVEELIDQEPWKGQLWARAALIMAARAIRRGRHLTAAERLENLKRALAEESPDGHR